MRRVTLVGVMAAAVVLGLAGCATPQELAVFRETQTEADRLPDGSAHLPDAIDEDSTRFLAETDGFDVYAARDNDGLTCLVVVDGESPEQLAASCGGGGVLESKGSALPHVRLIVDGLAESDPEDGWSRLAPNLLIKDD